MRTFLYTVIDNLKSAANSRARGFTIFLAVLISSLSLAVGVAIYDLTIRELDLTAAERESQYAVYAADTGIECALYWDAKYAGNLGSAFATSSTDTTLPGSGTGVTCNNQDIVGGAAPINGAWSVLGNAQAATTTFQFSMGTTLQKPCATVIVSKFGSPQQTTITSNGYDTCLTSIPTRTQRTIQVNY